MSVMFGRYCESMNDGNTGEDGEDGFVAVVALANLIHSRARAPKHKVIGVIAIEARSPKVRHRHKYTPIVTSHNTSVKQLDEENTQSRNEMTMFAIEKCLRELVASQPTKPAHNKRLSFILRDTKSHTQKKARH